MWAFGNRATTRTRCAATTGKRCPLADEHPSALLGVTRRPNERLASNVGSCSAPPLSERPGADPEVVAALAAATLQGQHRKPACNCQRSARCHTLLTDHETALFSGGGTAACRLPSKGPPKGSCCTGIKNPHHSLPCTASPTKVTCSAVNRRPQTNPPPPDLIHTTALPCSTIFVSPLNLPLCWKSTGRIESNFDAYHHLQSSLNIASSCIESGLP